MATKRPAKKKSPKTVKKTGKKTSPKSARKVSGGKDAEDFASRAARDPQERREIADFIKKMLTQSNVTFLSKEQSRRLLENIEFDGCIARPKNPPAGPAANS